MATQTVNASTPGLVGWTAGPETRGTLTLVWSCVITIFACTWTVLHLNVPGRTEGAMTITLRKMKWMAINVLFPEFIFAKAVCDLRLALEELREFDVNVTQKKTRLQLCGWTVSYEGVSHEWSWEFEYPLWARGLYGLLGLTPPEPPFNEKPLPQWISRIFSLIPSNAKSPEKSNDPEAQHSNGQKDPYANRATPSYNQQEIPKVSKDPDALSSRAQEASLSQTPQKASRAKWRTVQKWTVVHSYYAQMGGFLYQRGSSATGPLYYSCTASMLTERYLFIGDDCEKNLFRHLILSEQDIRDKSKADWVSKGLAIAQVSWLILSVIVRRIMDLPITQLEIGTVSFAVMAVLTYTVSWWKPQDVSNATILQTPAFGISPVSHRPSAYMRSPMLSIFSPNEAMANAKSVSDELQRVPNDIVWMEGNMSLLFNILAISSIVFGGLHCLAWSFEFPSEAELLCWRVASITSAALPAIALGINPALQVLLTKYLCVRIPVSNLLRRLEPLNDLPPDFWAHIRDPQWRYWSIDAKLLLVRTPPGLRNWEVETPTEGIIEQTSDETRYSDFWNFQSALVSFAGEWAKVRQSADMSNILRSGWLRYGSLMQEYSKTEGVLDFWQEYEHFIKKKHGIHVPDISDSSCIAFLLHAYNKTTKDIPLLQRIQEVYDKASVVLNIFSGVIYIIARLMILVLLLTCLRETPAGVYQETPWLNFLPNFS